MTSLTDKIGKHYQTAIAGELHKYHCEEWGTDIYFRTTHAFKDEAKIVELASKGMVVDALVETVLVKSRDADGKRLFTEADRIKLMNSTDRQEQPKTVCDSCQITSFFVPLNTSEHPWHNGWIPTSSPAVL